MREIKQPHDVQNACGNVIDLGGSKAELCGRIVLNRKFQIGNFWKNLMEAVSLFYYNRAPAYGEKRKRKVGGTRYEARSRGRSTPDTLAF